MKRYYAPAQAVPMTNHEYFKKKGVIGPFDEKEVKEGYMVSYGMISFFTWFSKEVFEAYFKEIKEESMSDRIIAKLDEHINSYGPFVIVGASEPDPKTGIITGHYVQAFGEEGEEWTVTITQQKKEAKEYTDFYEAKGIANKLQVWHDIKFPHLKCTFGAQVKNLFRKDPAVHVLSQKEIPGSLPNSEPAEDPYEEARQQPWNTEEHFEEFKGCN